MIDQPEAEALPESYFLMCSGCHTPTPNTEAHVIPYWNKTVESILTTYRCEKCWLPALAETREAVQSGEMEPLTTFLDFLSRQGYRTDAENLRSAPADEIRATLLAILEATADGRAVFHP